MGYVDIHSHILPGLDDGSQNIRQSGAMLEIAWNEGIDTIIATPHNMPGKGCPEKAVILERLQTLRDCARENNVPIRIYAGTEYFYRQEVLELLEEERAVTMGDSEYVLVEFDPMEEKVYIRNAVRDICGTGYRPILAHTERYMQLMRDLDTVRDIKKMGAMIQVNASSVTGDGGRKARADTKRLLRGRLADFVSTDAHSARSRAPLLEKCAKLLYAKFPAGYADGLLFANARQMLSGGGNI